MKSIKKQEEGLIRLIDTTDIQEDSFFEKFENKKVFHISIFRCHRNKKTYETDNVKERNGDSKHNKDKSIHDKVVLFS